MGNDQKAYDSLRTNTTDTKPFYPLGPGPTRIVLPDTPRHGGSGNGTAYATEGHGLHRIDLRITPLLRPLTNTTAGNNIRGTYAYNTIQNLQTSTSNAHTRLGGTGERNTRRRHGTGTWGSLGIPIHTGGMQQTK